VLLEQDFNTRVTPESINLSTPNSQLIHHGLVFASAQIFLSALFASIGVNSRLRNLRAFFSLHIRGPLTTLPHRCYDGDPVTRRAVIGSAIAVAGVIGLVQVT
jgi:hypothetical protein